MRWVRPVALVVALSVALGGRARAAQSPRDRSAHIPGTDLVVEAGWQLFSTPDGSCLYAVPGNWRLSAERGQEESPDRTSWLAVSRLVRADWSAYRIAVLAALAPARIREDGGGRLWVEQVDEGRRSHHLAVTDGSTVCVADLVVASYMAVIGERVAQSLRVLPDGWALGKR